jgi:hypothetical protein
MHHRHLSQVIVPGWGGDEMVRDDAKKSIDVGVYREGVEILRFLRMS